VEKALPERLEKASRLRELGFEPFGRRYERSHTTAEAQELFDKEGEGRPVTCAGRVTAIRRHGKATFFDIRDSSGRIQAYLKQGQSPDEAVDIFSCLDIGDFVGLDGELFKTRTGEVTVMVRGLTPLSKALLVLPEKWHGLRDAELRFRKRYLDLIANPHVAETFKARTKILQSIRRSLDQRGFMEVETPMMQNIPGGAAARPFKTHHNALDIDIYLRVAPELYLKRLLVGGMEKVYELNRNFRNEGVDRHHNPEFTMLEVYQAYADYNVMMELTEQLVAEAARELHGTTGVQFGDLKLDLEPPWPRLSYFDLLREHAGVTSLEYDELAEKAREHDLEIDPAWDAPAIIDELFKELVEPHLSGPLFVVDFPAALCPLTKCKPDQADIGERFEPYFAGMELGNGYSELNDPVEQEARFREQAARADEGHRAIDEDFVEALLHGMPPAGGLGIGIDRLVMLLTDSQSIRDVILFPFLRPVSDV